MNRLRSLMSGSWRVTRPVLTRIETPNRVKRVYHDHGPPQAFDNMPFGIPNRYAATFFFSVFFGLGLWAPFIILWYAMAKRTL